MTSTEDIKEFGVVGAGGAGFPAHVKLSRPARVLIINAAECEPLLHKDKEILSAHTERFFEGVSVCRELLGAERCIIGIKKKYTALIQKLQDCCRASAEIFPLDDFYPSGDEITLIFETTGRVIEAGALPISQGIVVQNVETVLNIARRRPVVTKFLTVAGAVRHPITLEAPIGTPFRSLVAQAVPIPERFETLVGGVMMGRLADSLDEPVTKTTGGLIVLPEDHALIGRYRTAASRTRVAIIGKSACDQCVMCTDLCPRYLLGHPIQPHRAMRSLLFSDGRFSADTALTHTMFCCECNLCTLMACPEGLYPAQTCIFNKRELVREKARHEGTALNRPHPFIAYRRTPLKKIMARLDLNGFINKGPLVRPALEPGPLEIRLRQHIGAPAAPMVTVGDTVSARQKIATVGDQLGAEIHAPSAGVVTAVTDRHIVIDARIITERKGIVMPAAIGIVELSSIASGFQVQDVMLKTAEVDLLVARSVCPGKYLVVVGGKVASVISSLKSGKQAAQGFLVDDLLISNVDPAVFPALSGSVELPERPRPFAGHHRNLFLGLGDPCRRCRRESGGRHAVPHPCGHGHRRQGVPDGLRRCRRRENRHRSRGRENPGGRRSREQGRHHRRERRIVPGICIMCDNKRVRGRS